MLAILYPSRLACLIYDLGSLNLILEGLCFYESAWGFSRKPSFTYSRKTISILRCPSNITLGVIPPPPLVVTGAIIFSPDSLKRDWLCCDIFSDTALILLCFLIRDLSSLDALILLLSPCYWYVSIESVILVVIAPPLALSISLSNWDLFSLSLLLWDFACLILEDYFGAFNPL